MPEIATTQRANSAFFSLSPRLFIHDWNANNKCMEVGDKRGIMPEMLNQTAQSAAQRNNVNISGICVDCFEFSRPQRRRTVWH